MTNEDSKALILYQKIRNDWNLKKVEKGIEKGIQQSGIGSGLELFLLDVSGSMRNKVNGKPKIKYLLDIMKKYPNYRKISFSSDIHDGIVTEPYGGTNMVLAFRYLQELNFGGKKGKKFSSVVLISDGMPQQPQEMVIEEALLLGVPVNIIFIGEKGTMGEYFMKNLAEATGGNEFTVETNKPTFEKSLFNGIAGYLTGACDDKNSRSH